MKYRVKEGKHVEGGKTYTKGDVVESSAPLDKMFIGKFEQVVATPAPIPETPKAPAPKPKAAAPEEEEEWPEETDTKSSKSSGSKKSTK